MAGEERDGVPGDIEVPLSALQHYAFCPRQCALIHLEDIWHDNWLTAEGRMLHKRVHEEGSESRGSLRIVRGLRLRSARLGLVGVADAVEFHRTLDDDPGGARIVGAPGRWRPYPVEYKRGRPKKDDSDHMQLAGQALCLAEMFSVAVPSGAFFYGRTRRRLEVTFAPALLERTCQVARAVRDLLCVGVTPPAEPGPRCKSCSLRESCLPGVGDHPVRRYLLEIAADTDDGGRLG